MKAVNNYREKVSLVAESLVCFYRSYGGCLITNQKLLVLCLISLPWKRPFCVSLLHRKCFIPFHFMIFHSFIQKQAILTNGTWLRAGMSHFLCLPLGSLSWTYLSISLQLASNWRRWCEGFFFLSVLLPLILWVVDRQWGRRGCLRIWA